MDNSASMGQIISHYRIVDRLGAGGMGIVFRAIDVRLEREVALKLLPSSAILDVGARERFRREARTLAKLNHPHIAAIYEFDSHEDIDFLAMEYVRGTTLLDEVRAGEIDLSRMLTLGSQICDALDAAHEQGIVHRDLKPANIAITTKGKAKVLDFGIAKLLQSGTASSVTELTGAGRIVGTLPYMAPEQLRGEEVDHRSDIYATGVVLYEMATGRRPHFSEHQGRLVDAILHEEPIPPSRLSQRLPASLDAPILKALQKEPSQRYQAASELGADLDRLLSPRSRAIGDSKDRVRPRWVVGGLAAALIFLVTISLILARIANRGQGSPKQLTQRQLTSYTPDNRVVDASVSPDGKSLVFSSTGGLFLRSLETGDTRAVPLPADSSLPLRLSWFQSGDRFLATMRGDKGNNIWEISVLGWKPRNLGFGISAAPSPDGSRIAVIDSEGGIWLMNTEGEERHRIKSSINIVRLAWSPDGHRLGYIQWGQDGGSIASCDLEGHTVGILPGDLKLAYPFGGESSPSLCWLPGGRIVYARTEPPPNQTDANLWEIDVNSETGHPVGPPRRITNWVESFISGISSTSDGDRLAVLRSRAQMDIYVGELSGKGRFLGAPHRVTLDERNDWITSWGHDSRTIFFTSDRNGDADVFRMGINDGEAALVAGGPGAQGAPTLSPDGRWIFFLASSDSSGISHSPKHLSSLMRVPVSGGPQETVLGPAKYTGFRCGRYPGTICAIAESKEDGTLVFIMFDPILGRIGDFGKIRLNKPTASWDLAPDGSKIAILDDAGHGSWIRVLDRSGKPATAFPVKGMAWCQNLTWSAEGDGFFLSGFSEGSRLFRCDSAGNSQPLPMASNSTWIGSPSPSPDGRYLGFNSLIFETNAWEIGGF